MSSSAASNHSRSRGLSLDRDLELESLRAKHEQELQRVHEKYEAMKRAGEVPAGCEDAALDAAMAEVVAEDQAAAAAAAAGAREHANVSFGPDEVHEIPATITQEELDEYQAASDAARARGISFSAEEMKRKAEEAASRNRARSFSRRVMEMRSKNKQYRSLGKEIAQKYDQKVRMKLQAVKKRCEAHFLEKLARGRNARQARTEAEQKAREVATSERAQLLGSEIRNAVAQKQEIRTKKGKSAVNAELMLGMDYVARLKLEKRRKVAEKRAREAAQAFMMAGQQHSGQRAAAQVGEDGLTEEDRIANLRAMNIVHQRRKSATLQTLQKALTSNARDHLKKAALSAARRRVKWNQMMSTKGTAEDGSVVTAPVRIPPEAKSSDELLAAVAQSAPANVKLLQYHVFYVGHQLEPGHSLEEYFCKPDDVNRVVFEKLEEIHDGVSHECFVFHADE